MTEQAPEGFDQADFEKFVAIDETIEGTDSHEAKKKAAEEEKAAVEEEKEHSQANEAEEEAPEPETGETEEEQAPKVDVELLAKSTQALKRYGMTAAMVNKLSSEEIIEAGARLLKIQEDNDKAHSKLKTLELKEKPADGDKTPATVTADVSKVSKRLAEKLGIEEADAPLLDELVGEAFKPLVARIEAMEAREGHARIQSALHSVAEVYEFDLKDAATTDKLIDKAQRISGGYDNERDCLLDAAKIIGLSARSEAEAAAKASAQVAEHGRKRTGLPTSNGRAAPASAKSWEDLEQEAMVALEDGDRDKGNRLLALSRAARGR